MIPLVAVATLAMITAPAIPGAGDLTAGLGTAEHGVLSMRFEVTFMKIDVADVEVFVTSADAARIEAAIGDGARTSEREAAVTAIIADADPMAVSMRYLRDAGYDRFTKGIASGVDAAYQGEQLTDDERRSVHDQFLIAVAGLEERGVKEGDVLVYRVDEDQVSLRVVDAAGLHLADATYRGDMYPRAVRGMYVCCKSDFLEKLVRSAFTE
jgi:hypothetical protein